MTKPITQLFSLLYALIIAFSYHYWGQSYIDAKDLVSPDNKQLSTSPAPRPSHISVARR